MVCIVDFDGTFVKNDFFKERIFKRFLENPIYFVKYFLLKKKSLLELKFELLTDFSIEYDIDFLINPIVRNWIIDNKNNYNYVILVSATPEFFLKKILKSITIFDEIYGSVDVNLKGKNKLDFIQKKWGENFDYIGDSNDDLPIFHGSRNAFKITKNGIQNI
jgi:hypothetical protein